MDKNEVLLEQILGRIDDLLPLVKSNNRALELVRTDLDRVRSDVESLKAEVTFIERRLDRLGTSDESTSFQSELFMRLERIERTMSRISTS